MKRTTVFLDEALLKGLRQAARREGKSFAAVLREAVAFYLGRGSGESGRRVPTIAGQFASGCGDTAERQEDLLWQEPHA